MANSLRLLVATDLSESGTHAIFASLELARMTQCEILVFHCIEEIPHVDDKALSTRVHALYEKLKAKVSAEILSHLKAHQGDSVRIEVAFGHPTEAIIHHAEQFKPDFVVIGKGSSAGLEELLGGTTTHNLIRGLNCGLLVAKSASLSSKGRVLVPVDLGPLSLVGLERGFALASVLGSKVTVLHAQSYLSHSIVLDLPGEGGEDLLKELLSQHSAKLNAMLEPYRDKGLVEDVRLVQGRPVQEIISASKDFDLVVVASESGSSWTKSLLGSNAEAVINRSPVSVLAVKA